jgi:hypothetical protein
MAGSTGRVRGLRRLSSKRSTLPPYAKVEWGGRELKAWLPEP